MTNKLNTLNAWLKSVRLWNIVGLIVAVVFIRFSYFGQEMGWLFVVPVAFIAGGGAIINDYFDIKEERIRKPEKARMVRVIKRRVAMMSHWVLTGLGLGGGTLVISTRIDDMTPFIIAATAAILIFFIFDLAEEESGGWEVGIGSYSDANSTVRIS